MAAAILAPYSPDHFQSLPSLEEAKTSFLLEANGEELIVNLFRDLFIKEGMDRIFGLAMLHRHFDLGSDEKLVEYRGTSTPWEGAIPGMKDPQAAIWAFDKDGLLKPTEFHYSEKQDAPLPENALEFVDKFKVELNRLGLTKALGLARYPGDGFRGSCEVTLGRANINLNPEDYPANLKHISTVWFFSEPLWTRGCRCTCNANAKDHPHGKHVYTVSA